MSEKRFRAINHIHNVLVKHASKLLRRLDKDKAYQTLLSKCHMIKLEGKDSRMDDVQKAWRKARSKRMAGIRSSIGLSEYDLQSYIKVCAKQFRKCLFSQQVQKEMTHVWRSVEAVLFGNGNNLHFRKLMEANTIGGKSNTNGVKFDKVTFSISWLGPTIKCRPPPNNDDAVYLAESLDYKISYCENTRKMFPSGWHYYVTVYLDGNTPLKHRRADKVTGNLMGIDPGVSTMAGVSGTAVFLEELAPECKTYTRKIIKLQKKMDRSRRATNPDKYNENGTIKKGYRGRWKRSNAYIKNQRKLKSLYRQKAAYTKQSHEELASRLIGDSLNFIVEDMSYRALQRRTKRTECQEEASDVAQNDGITKKVRKYKRKKRFGKSLNNRAPALFLTILEQKAVRCGGTFVKVDTRSYKASQYNHAADSYNKTPLSQRNKIIGEHKVQRDLYSAFLIRNSNDTYDHPDRLRCVDGFETFLDMQYRLFSGMKQSGLSMKHCYGF